MQVLLLYSSVPQLSARKIKKDWLKISFADIDVEQLNIGSFKLFKGEDNGKES